MTRSTAASQRPMPSEPIGVALLREVLAGQREILGRLTAIEALVRRPSSRAESAADAEFLAVLVSSVGGRTFTAVELLAHAAVDPALAKALVDSLIETAREVGHVLRRLEQRSGPITVQRVGKSREGILWRVRVSPVTNSLGACSDT